MGLDWRKTLSTLLSQFEAQAARSSGLHHLFVEVADHEREKWEGPDWFQPFSGKVSVIDGRLQYSKWDCSSSSGLPGISPGFREALPTEQFEHAAEGVVRDGSGVPRAVATPMKLCQGYFCGQPSEEVTAFSSLANSAASTLAGAQDLHEHVYASDLTDIFRKPRGGVRYVFGDVPAAPKQFIARGWSAGVLQFENGVLIDVPIAEDAPGAGHWMLLLHRLGWRQIDGSPLRAQRWAWDANVEVDFEMLKDEQSRLPEQLAARFAEISPDSYYSVLGTNDVPLDINLASAFAIQLLLADLSVSTSSVQAESAGTVDYSREDWKITPTPTPRTVTHDECKEVSQPKVGILVATEVERSAVLKKMRPPKGKRSVLQVYSGDNTCFVGRLGITDIVLCMTSVGSLGRDSSMMVTADLIESWELSAVVMVGIAFGKDAGKQDIGNVLVSDRIISYEPERVGSSKNQDRGSQHMAGSVLLNRFRNVVGWSFGMPDGNSCGFQVGPILSGEKLVDNPEFKRNLFQRFPTAIGGDMEGAGVAAAAERKRCEWIVVKAICDWGDGTKTNHHQEFAAASSVDLVEHVLNQVGALDSL